MSADNVVPIRGAADPVPDRNPHDAFVHARKAMLAAFADWVKAVPHPADVAMEVDGTAQAMKSIYRLEADDGA